MWSIFLIVIIYYYHYQGITHMIVQRVHTLYTRQEDHIKYRIVRMSYANYYT